MFGCLCHVEGCHNSKSTRKERVHASVMNDMDVKEAKGGLRLVR